MNIRDRVVEYKKVKASELRPNARNWRTHPAAQRDAFKGILAEVGFAGAVLTRELEDGSLEIIDGHLRAETTPDMEVPVIVTDLDDGEAAKLLAVFDPLGAMAGRDEEKLTALLQEVQTDNPAIQDLLNALGAGNNALEDGFVIDPEDDEDQLSDVQVVVGEYRFVIKRDAYLEWQENLRQTYGFEQSELRAAIRERLQFSEEAIA